MKYRRLKETLYNDYIGQYLTYGIADGNGKTIVQDVSVDKTFVDDIIYLLNKYSASLVHVRDIVEDMLL